MPIELPVDEQATPVLTAEVSHFIENMGLYYENQGVPRIGGRILGLLLMTVQQLSAEHIAATLAVSRSSVSTNIRLLLASGLVEKVAFPGDRRDYYRFAPSPWERAIMLRMENVATLKALAEQGLAALSVDDPTRQQAAGMIDWVTFASAAYTRLLEDWRAWQVQGRE